MGFLFAWTATPGVVEVVLLLLLLGAYRAFVSPRRAKFPPGPPALPILGNVLQIPSDSQEEVFTEWGRKYGDIVYIKIFKQPMIIINDLQTARDLLDKRSSIYSDRPRFVLLSELMGWSSASTHMRYGPRFRKHRRFINQVFNQRAIAALRPLQEKEILVLLEGLRDTPADFVDHFRRYAAATILKITYGHDIVSVDDLFVRLAERAGTLTVEAGSPAANMVDFFPIMKHIPTWAPFSAFKVKALVTRTAVEAMMRIPYEQVVADMKSGTAVPSYTSTLLEAHRGPAGALSPEDEEDIRGSAGTLFAGALSPHRLPCTCADSDFIAAEDTTIASLHTLMLTLLQYPEEQRRAQREIDEVVGPTRLPTLADRPALPYLESLLKETIRLNPMVPLGLPHRLMEDDTYRGFHVPEGTNVLANIYAILRACADPDAFRPERYLEDDTLPDPFSVIFGFGRRICPGRHLAETSYWTIGACVIAAFDVAPAAHAGDAGYGFTTGFVRHPKPFKCAITPRASTLTALIEQARGELPPGA
ncbi:hypothetical protein HYPSUDRAFT_139604 [Hypholoma sublateritium FD-334 SS-4]|uniref:Cytochrome P450 n=1 Tax=Hypholoma sublateritium (strain FD-334 SS-4) TaxID=945553 RepID=A0A0D2MEX6_HYPSF|nr:hypothetical protein HYPSUDRAFT_139604 [Hypholoma sublateritium FD-334 SS-4]